MNAEAVKEKFGVGPEKVVEILGLMGDTSTISRVFGHRPEKRHNVSLKNTAQWKRLLKMRKDCTM